MSAPVGLAVIWCLLVLWVGLRRLTKHETFQDYGMIGLLWLASLGVIYVLPATGVGLRYDLGYVATVVWFIISIIYWQWEKIAPHSPEILNKVVNFVNYLWIGYLFFAGGFTVAVGVLTWSTFTVNGVLVFTYVNALNFFLDVFGLILIWAGIRHYFTYRKVRRNRVVKDEFADTALSVGTVACPKCGSDNTAKTWALSDDKGNPTLRDGAFPEDWKCTECGVTSTLYRKE